MLLSTADLGERKLRPPLSLSLRAQALSFLLDGLHEDLNRIEKKKCFEQPESDGSSRARDAEVAAETLRLNRTRNDSAVRARRDREGASGMKLRPSLS